MHDNINAFCQGRHNVNADIEETVFLRLTPYLTYGPNTGRTSNTSSDGSTYTGTNFLINIPDINTMYYNVGIFNIVVNILLNSNLIILQCLHNIYSVVYIIRISKSKQKI